MAYSFPQGQYTRQQIRCDTPYEDPKLDGAAQGILVRRAQNALVLS